MKSQRGKSTLILAAALLASCLWMGEGLAATPDSSVQGQLTVNGKTITLRYAYAVAGPDTMDGTKEAFLVLLTENALAPNAINEADSFATLGGKSVESLVRSGLSVEVGPDRGYHLTIRHPALKDKELQSSAFSGLKIATMGPDRVAGTFASSSGMGKSDGDGGPEEITPNHIVQYKVRFDVPIARRFPLEEKLELGPKPIKLPAGGGDPGKAWLDHDCKAAPALPDLKDPKAAEQYFRSQGMTEKALDEEVARQSKLEGRKVTRDEVIKKMAEMIGAMADLGSAIGLKDCKVLSGLHDGKVAILQVEATMGGQRLRTDIKLSRQNGAWTVRKTGAWGSPP